MCRKLESVQAFVEELEALGMFPASFSMQLNLVLEKPEQYSLYAYAQGSSQIKHELDFVAGTRVWKSPLQTVEKPLIPLPKKTPTSTCRPRNVLSVAWEFF
jgi:hypothetical protein